MSAVRKALVEEWDDAECQPLHYAAEHHSLDVARLLIDRKADIEVTDIYGHSALHVAADNNSVNVARLLVHRFVYATSLRHSAADYH